MNVRFLSEAKLQLFILGHLGNHLRTDESDIFFSVKRFKNYLCDLPCALCETFKFYTLAFTNHVILYTTTNAAIAAI